MIDKIKIIWKNFYEKNEKSISCLTHTLIVEITKEIVKSIIQWLNF
jgi:hypothetical protein